MRERWPTWVGLGLVLLAVFFWWQWGGEFFRLLRQQERIRQWLAGFGPLAPVASVGLNALQVLLAPVPGQVIGLANGYLFGVFWGTVYSLLGVTLGSALAMGLGRWLGRPAVERLVDGEKLARWDRITRRRGPLFFFLIFVLPLLPDDVTCFLIGLSPLSLPYILGLATIGRLPGLIVASWLGAHAASLSPGGWLVVVVGALLLGGAYLRYREDIEAGLLRLTGRWGG